MSCYVVTPNAAESAIRPVALVRKNRRFVGAPKGMDASAMLISLVATAKANEIEHHAYLRYFSAGHGHMRALMPQHVDKSLL